MVYVGAVSTEPKAERNWLALAALSGGLAVGPSSAAWNDRVVITCLPARVPCPATVTFKSERSKDAGMPVALGKGGLAHIPASLIDAPAWTVEAPGFEPATYRRADIEEQQPLRLFALGRISGKLGDLNGAEPEIELLAQKGEQPGLVERKISVDPAGRFTLDLPRGVYHFVIFRSGRAADLHVGQVVEPGETIDIGVTGEKPAGHVHFRVLDSRSRRPVPGAAASWDPAESQVNFQILRTLMAKRWSASADSTGRVRFSGLGDVLARWTVSAPGYVRSKTGTFRPRPGQIMDGGTISLASGATLTVNAVLPAGIDPSHGAVALLARDQAEDGAFTQVAAATLSPQYRARFQHLSPGTYRALLRLASGTALTYTDTLLGEGDDILNVVASEKHVRGCVTRDKMPVAAAMIEANEGRAQLQLASTSAGENGCYSLTLYHAGPVLILARAKKGTNFAIKRVDLTTGDDADVNFALASHEYRFVVRDAKTESPIAGAAVKAKLEFSELSKTQDTSRALVLTGVTDSDGVFALEDLRQGGGEFTFQAHGYRSATMTTTASPEGSKEREVLLQPAPILHGHVVDQFGSPIPGATLVDSEAKGFRYFAESDAAGRFEIFSPPETPTLFFAFAPGYALTATFLLPLSTTDSSQRVVLQPPRGLPLVLAREDGPPLVNVQVAVGLGAEPFPPSAIGRVARANGLEQKQLDATGLDGSVILPAFLEPGRYTVFVVVQPKAEGDSPLYFPVGEVDTPLRSTTVLVVRDPRKR